MEDDSPGVQEQGRTFWSGLRTLLFGDEGESTLRDEIEEAIENREGEAPRVGDLSNVERQMLRNILHFGEKTVSDVAVPRADIVAVPATITLEGLVAAFAEAGHSRLPVYEDSLDTVIGMIHVKDVFALQVTGAEPPEDIRQLVRAPLYVPESMGVLDLLARMRRKRKGVCAFFFSRWGRARTRSAPSGEPTRHKGRSMCNSRSTQSLSML